MNKSYIEKKLEEHIIQYKEKHYRLAYSYVKNEQDALDILQESIYKAMKSITNLKNEEFIKTWFYRIIVNTSIDFIRKKNNVVLIDDNVLNYEEGVIDNYKNVDLELALLDLPEIYRTIVILRFFEDLKIKEIAEVLNENTNTIKTRLYKALEILKIKLD